MTHALPTFSYSNVSVAQNETVLANWVCAEAQWFKVYGNVRKRGNSKSPGPLTLLSEADRSDEEDEDSDYDSSQLAYSPPETFEPKILRSKVKDTTKKETGDEEDWSAVMAKLDMMHFRPTKDNGYKETTKKGLEEQGDWSAVMTKGNSINAQPAKGNHEILELSDEEDVEETSTLGKRNYPFNDDDHEKKQASVPTTKKQADSVKPTEKPTDDLKAFMTQFQTVIGTINEKLDKFQNLDEKVNSLILQSSPLKEKNKNNEKQIETPLKKNIDKEGDENEKEGTP